MSSVHHKGPLLVSIIGTSDSGKTTLILKLLPELQRRGYKVAVAKHCPCGFDLDREGKDSWRFTQAGGRGTFLTSGDAIALIRPLEEKVTIKERLLRDFADFDIVLMEGYHDVASIEKMQIIRRGIGPMETRAENIVAYLTDTELTADKPVLDLNNTAAIVALIETLRGRNDS
jgi:molybdopterin-guanine dinucleotide biosynthesis protein B